jgi:hypothetical protein
MSFFSQPGRLGRLREGGQRISAFLEELARLQQELRATLDVDGEELERNRRLVRTWDGLSHDLLLELAPRVRAGVPSGAGLVDLSVGRSDGLHTLDPWPFHDETVVVRTEGRLLRGPFADEEAMRRALADAPWVELAYELRPG